jgi:hypothetical protein
MKAEREISSNNRAALETEIAWPEPQSAWGAELLALLKAMDASGIPKLSVEEIEAYLERSPGAVYPDESVRQNATFRPETNSSCYVGR